MLILDSLPIIGIAFAQSYEQFLFCRILIGFISASFAITQVRTSLIFAPSCVGTANTTSAGWGNLGGANRLGVPVIAGIVIACFSQITYFPAIVVLIMFSLSVQVVERATFTVVPFVNEKCADSVSGIAGKTQNSLRATTA